MFLDVAVDQNEHVYPMGARQISSGHAAVEDGAKLMQEPIISVLLENEAGALSIVVDLFAQRNYNIESLTVAPTEDATLCLKALTTLGDDKKIEQITKQLNKLMGWLRWFDLKASTWSGEYMLVGLRSVGAQRAEIKRTDIFRGQIVDATESAYTVQLVGVSSKLDAFSGPSASSPFSRWCALASPALLGVKRWSASRRWES